MIYKELVITNNDGLKAKAAASFVQVANQFDSQILIEFSNKKINAKSIMGLLSLGVKSGESIYVFANGVDEKEAIDALNELVESNFGE
ncbi:PTS sugar transporter subunit IIA [Christensenellaceae bacterium]|nr:PTS sugar transporter subunit IIA [Christensenellaceae bacterium]BDF62071.1 PTS sugar transporter subunit IIA [Christensenellaceae bacterium]